MPKKTPPPAERLGRPAEVIERYRIGESTLWRWVAEREGFPQPRKLGPSVTVFSLDELDAFFAQAASPKKATPTTRKQARA